MLIWNWNEGSVIVGCQFEDFLWGEGAMLKGGKRRERKGGRGVDWEYKWEERRVDIRGRWD